VAQNMAYVGGAQSKPSISAIPCFAYTSIVYTVTGLFRPTVTQGATNSGGTGNATLTLTLAHTVTLTWVASTSPNIAGYNIYRGTTSLSGPYSATPVNSDLINYVELRC
jgi:hypothetical protein